MRLPFTVDRVAAGAAGLTAARVRMVFLLAGKPPPGDEVAPEEALLLWLDDLLGADAGLPRDLCDALVHALAAAVLAAGREIWAALERYERGARPGPLVAATLLLLDQRYARVGAGPLIDLRDGQPAEMRQAPLRGLGYDLTALFVRRRARMSRAEPGRQHRDARPAVVPPRPKDE